MEVKYQKERGRFRSIKHVVKGGRGIELRWKYAKYAQAEVNVAGVFIRRRQFRATNLAGQIAEAEAFIAEQDADHVARLILSRKKDLEAQVYCAAQDLAQKEAALKKFNSRVRA